MKMQLMSNDEIRKVAPSAFATQAYERMSQRYAFIPTFNVIEQMRSTGLVPVNASQSVARIEGKREFAKHRIRFMREADLRHFGQGGFYRSDEQPEIPMVDLVNGHDGSSAYVLDAGIFVVRCANGLVVCSSSLGSIRVRHSGNVVDDVLEGTYSIINEFPGVIERIGEMKAITLQQPQQQAFANAAALLKWTPDEKTGALPVNSTELLRARRRDEQTPTLWNTFNVVQENLLKGGVVGRSTSGRRTRTRAVGSVSEDVRLNRALWVLAESMKQYA